MLFALGRDGACRRALAARVARPARPARGLAFVMVLDLAILVVFASAGKPSRCNVFFYFATIGT